MAALAAAALAVAATLACRHHAEEDVATEAAVTVEVAPAHLTTVSAVVAATGTVEPAPGADVTITAPGPSKIVSLPYAVGDRVPGGAVVARFDTPSLRADLASRAGELAQAQAHVTNAQANHARLTRLLERGIASRKEVEDAARDLREAEASLKQGGATHAAAADMAARSTATAPFPAVVAERWHNPNDLVDANEHVVRLVDPRRLQVMASVPAADVVRLSAGRSARVMIPGAPLETAQVAKLVSGAGAVDPATGTAPVRLALNSPLPTGTPVQVEITAEEHANVLAVPRAAVVREDEDTFVYVVGADSKAHRRAVQLGLEGKEEVEVASGLQAGEQVVVHGQQELPDGAQVTVEKPGAEKPDKP